MTTAVKYDCNGKVRLSEQKISDLLHDGHRFGNVVLKGMKSLIVSSRQKNWTKRTLPGDSKSWESPDEADIV